MSDVPRISPVSEGDLTPEQRDLLATIGGTAPVGDGVAGGVDEGVANIFTTLVRHPGLFRKWLPFGGKLLAGKLPARDRELLILRTAVRCDSPYEWVQHVRIGRRAGLSTDEIDRVRQGPDAWAGFDAVLLTAADELHDQAMLSQPTWAGLAEHYDDLQLIEVPMVVGHYHMVAFALNTLGVQLEPGVSAHRRSP